MALVHNVSSTDDVNNAVKESSHISYDNAFKIFGKRVVIDNSTNDKKNNNEHEWVNDSCKRERQKFHKMHNFYQRHPMIQQYILVRN